MLSINFSELIWTVLAFLVLFWSLNRFLYRPLIAFMDARKSRIEEGASLAREAETALADAGAKAAENREKSESAARSILQEAQDDFSARHRELMQEAADDRETALDRIRGRSDETKAALHQEITEHREELAQQLLARLLGQ